MLQPINPTGAPAPIGPYSPAVLAGGVLYISGQLPVDASGNIPDGIAAQTKQSLTNLRALIDTAHLSMSNVAQVTVLLTDMADFTAMNEVYDQFFTAPYPSRVTYQVAALPKGALVEISAIAA